MLQAKRKLMHWDPALHIMLQVSIYIAHQYRCQHAGCISGSMCSH